MEFLRKIPKDRLFFLHFDDIFIETFFFRLQKKFEIDTMEVKYEMIMTVRLCTVYTVKMR